MPIAVLGIDIAKSVFPLYGVDERGRSVLSKRVSRGQLGRIVAKLPACVIAMEACSTSTHWARRFQAFGHDVRLIHPNFVRPYVKGNKNDALDADAICEAASRPTMRFMATRQALHRARERLMRWRTGLINQVVSPDVV
jgi:transposase